MHDRARIPTYWIVDLVNDCVEVHTDPTPDGYRQIAHQRRGDPLLSGLTVEDVVPRG